VRQNDYLKDDENSPFLDRYSLVFFATMDDFCVCPSDDSILCLRDNIEIIIYHVAKVSYNIAYHTGRNRSSGGKQSISNGTNLMEALEETVRGSLLWSSNEEATTIGGFAAIGFCLQSRESPRSEAFGVHPPDLAMGRVRDGLCRAATGRVLGGQRRHGHEGTRDPFGTVRAVPCRATQC
jgi:hypothetical protein